MKNPTAARSTSEIHMTLENEKAITPRPKAHAGPGDLPSQAEHGFSGGQEQRAGQRPDAHGGGQEAQRFRSAVQHFGGEDRHQHHERHRRKAHHGQQQKEHANRMKAEGVEEPFLQFEEDVLGRAVDVRGATRIASKAASTAK